MGMYFIYLVNLDNDGDWEYILNWVVQVFIFLDFDFI